MKRFISILLLITLSYSQCKKKEENIDSIIRKGIESLQNDDLVNASHYFSKVIEKDPRNPRARMGMAMVQAMVLFKQVERVVIEIGNIIVQVIGGFSPRLKTDAESQNDQPTLNDIIFYVVDSNLLQPISLILENSDIAAESPEDWSFYIERITWTIKFKDTIFWQISITGEVDKTDAALFSSLFRLVESVLKLIISIDIHVDVRNMARIYNYIEEIGGLAAIQKDPKIVIMNIIPFILNERETFLGIEQKRGLQYMKEDIPLSIKKMSEYGIKFYDSILAEQDDQDDDVISLEISGESEKVGLISFPTSSTYFYDKELTDKKGKMVASINIPPPDLKYFFGNIIKSVDEGTMTKWGDIAEITSFLIVAILKTGIFDTIINTIVSAVGGRGLPPNLLSNIGSIINPGFISGFIKGIIPDQIGFSLKALFDKPVSIRDILPAWTKDNNFIVEWECISESPNVSPLAEDNPIFMLFCKYPKTRYCFKKSDERCNIRYQQCVLTPISVEGKACDNYCGEDCRDQKDQQEICIERNEKDCVRFCILKEEIMDLSGNTIQSGCRGSLYFADEQHFTKKRNPAMNIKYEPIPQDGIFSILPYVMLQSPDIYGFLFINKDFLRSSVPAAYRGNIIGQGYQKPNNFEVNIFIQIIGKNLLNIFSQFGVM